MRALILLEFRKQRSSFLSILTILALLAALSMMSAAFFLKPWRMLDVYAAVLGFLLNIAIPLFGVILGSHAGAHLRREPEIEEVPAHPSKRIGAAYLVSLSYFLLILLPILFFYTQNSDLQIFERTQADTVNYRTWFVQTIHLHFLSFAASFWLKRGVLGGGIAIIIYEVENLLAYLDPATRYQWQRISKSFTFDHLLSGTTVVGWCGGLLTLLRFGIDLFRGNRALIYKSLIFWLALLTGPIIFLLLYSAVPIETLCGCEPAGSLPYLEH